MSDQTTGDTTVSWQQRVAELSSDANGAYLLALRATGSRAIAEDAVQEAFAKLLRKPMKDEGPAQLRLYLLKAVRGTAIDLLKSEQRRRRRESERMMPAESKSPNDDANSAREMAQAARAALSTLPTEEREAVSLHIEQNLTQREAAEILGIPERTVSHRVQDGLQRLRSILATGGFASVTPLALDQSLRGLGIPNAPSGVHQAITQLVNATQHSARIARTSVAAKSSGLVAASAVVVLGAAIFGIWSLSRSNTAAPQTRSAPATLPASAQPEQRPLLNRAWVFRNAEAVEVPNGKLEPLAVYEPATISMGKVMGLAYPIRLSDRPLRIETVVDSPFELPFELELSLVQDKKNMAHTLHPISPPPSRITGKFSIVVWFYDEHAVWFLDRRLHGVVSYKAPISQHEVKLLARRGRIYSITAKEAALDALPPEVLNVRNLLVERKLEFGPPQHVPEREDLQAQTPRDSSRAPRQ